MSSKTHSSLPQLHWREITSDPNDPQAVYARRKLIKEASRPPVANREDYLVNLVRGKRLLDVGVVDHEAKTAKEKDSWLHKRLSEAAAYCLGVDVLEEDVLELNRQGFNIKHIDITSQSLNEKFDVIVCGELIEHLDRPGDLFAAAKKLLAPQGRFVLTSPNPYMLYQVIRQTFGYGNDSVDHALFVFPSGIAELASRHGLQLESYRGTWLAGHRSFKHKLLKTICQPFSRSELYCPTMIYECVAHK